MNEGKTVMFYEVQVGHKKNKVNILVGKEMSRDLKE